MSKRTYKKIDELTFRYEEDKHFDIKVDAVEMLNQLAQAVNSMKQLVVNVNKIQDQFVKVVEGYNTYRDILEEANQTVKLAIEIPPRIELPDCFSIIEVKLENLPKVKVVERENTTEEKKQA